MTYLNAEIGDITDDLQVEAIVNTANKTLSSKGGKVNQEIHKAAGPQLEKECRLLYGCRPGDAKITNAFNLPCKYIVHTVGPIWKKGKNNEALILSNCYINSLAIAEEFGIKTIAFPSISTGANGYPYNNAADIAVNSVKKYLEEHPGAFEKIIWVMQDEKAKMAYEAVINDDSQCPKNGEDPLDYELMRANRKYNASYYRMDKSGESLFEIRGKSADLIENVESFVNTISNHPKDFESSFVKIQINKRKFKKACDFGNEAKRELEKSARGAGAGIAAGAAVASMAPSAAMWIATTFGTASTGTAISALSGAAATNAALAWLGGGALAASGGGMVAGQALLALAGPVGWGLAGVSIFASVMIWFGGKKKRAEKKKQEISMIQESISNLNELTAKIESLTVKTTDLFNNLNKMRSDLEHLRNSSFEELEEEDQFALGALVNNTLSLSKLLSMTIDEDNFNE